MLYCNFVCVSSRPYTKDSTFLWVLILLQYAFSWINYAAYVRNVAGPCAWSAKHYYKYKETHYCNDDSRGKMLHSTTVGYLYTSFLMITGLLSSVVVKIYKNILGC